MCKVGRKKCVEYLEVEDEKWGNRYVRLLLRGVVRGPFTRKNNLGAEIIDSGGTLDETIVV